jgi:dethiobiotin synthetase
MARWRASVVLCARTTLGTINHSLLSIEALRARGIAILGIAFIGDENAESERIITISAACSVSAVFRISRRSRLTRCVRPLSISSRSTSF